MENQIEQIVSYLPEEIGRAVKGLSSEWKEQMEELRFRAGYKPTVLLKKGEEIIRELPAVKSTQLYDILELASEYSAHCAMERVINGFVTLPGGHRMGLCGTARMEHGCVIGFDAFSSLNIRVAREQIGIARSVMAQIMGTNGPESTLILAPPGVGKTTLLRDLVRCLSVGDGCSAYRVGVADERSELGACWNGMPQMDLGRQTDLMDGVPKAKAIYMLLRGMNPQVLAVDEITKDEDVEAICQAAGCGVSLLATAHASDLKGMDVRPIYKKLLRQNIFRRAVMIQRGKDGERIIEVEGIPCCD